MRPVSSRTYDSPTLWFNGCLKQQVIDGVWDKIGHQVWQLTNDQVAHNVTSSLYDVIIQFRRRHLS